MPARHFPVYPDLEQLRHQAKELLRAIRRGDPEALDDLRTYHPERPDPAHVKLADAQLVLARSYKAPSWPRVVQACALIRAICRDDLEGVRALVTRHPNLLHEDARIRDGNWGPPMSYAANLGRDRIVELLHALGARDHVHALGRAALQGEVGTAKLLHRLMGSPLPPEGALAGPAYTLSASGTRFALEIGAPVRDAAGRPLAPVDVVLETDARDPAAKHAILDLYVAHGVELPDTPTMAVHRGRVDLLEAHLRRDPGLLRRTFTHEEIFPPELGCHEDPLSTHGTPLHGATLLHMAIDFDEQEIARWLLARGMDANAPAAVDARGFGGHTPLFATVVSQPAFWMNFQERPQEAPMARLLLDHGADPNARASLRKRLHPGYDDDAPYDYPDVTPLAWGERFHQQKFVSRPAMALIAERGGRA